MGLFNAPRAYIDDDEGDQGPVVEPIPGQPGTPSGGPDAGTGHPPSTPAIPGDDVAANGNHGHGGGGGGGYDPGNGPTFNLPGAPVFTPPQFNRPTLQDAYNEPGYQFRAQAGNQALERSAAARGVLRTGGTLKDLVEYGQNFAANEYGQVYNRALGAYDRQYQGARDAFSPVMARYQAQLAAERERALALYNTQFQVYAMNHRGGGGGGGYGGEPPPDPGSWVPGGPPTEGTRLDTPTQPAGSDAGSFSGYGKGHDLYDMNSYWY